jgi:hypothetical protein
VDWSRTDDTLGHLPLETPYWLLVSSLSRSRRRIGMSRTSSTAEPSDIRPFQTWLTSSSSQPSMSSRFSSRVTTAKSREALTDTSTAANATSLRCSTTWTWTNWGHAGLVVPVGRSLLAGLVRAVPVVMAGILAQHRSQVPFAVDEHPVGALGSCCADPSLGIAVRARGLRRDLDRVHALAGEDRVEDASEFGVAVPDDKAERRGPVAEVHEQVAGLLSSPCAVWVGGQAQDVHIAGLDLHDEQHVQASEEDGAGVEEVAGQ